MVYLALMLWSGFCFVAGMVYQQKNTLIALERQIKDDSYGKEENNEKNKEKNKRVKIVTLHTKN